LFDSLILAPLLLTAALLEGTYPCMSPWACLLTAALALGYVVYCHGKWGQTLGKRVAAIQLRQGSGLLPTWQNAWLRSSVDILLMLFALTAAALISPGDGSVNAGGVLVGLVAGADLASGAWQVAKLLVHVADKRRRAVHDLLAGTVVIQLEDARASRRVAWILVPGLILLLLFVASPIVLANWQRAQEVARLNQIRINLLLINNAKENWAFEKRKDARAEPVPQDLLPYFAARAFPSPVAGETYQVNPVGTSATARLSSGLLNYPAGSLVDRPLGFEPEGHTGHTPR
jgi:uncharacterized RDD family membrane protein YckC